MHNREFRMIFTVQLRPALVLCCLVFIASTHSAAQQTSPSQGTPYNFQVNVNRVLVPVVVRDAKGRVVSDLKEEDFQIFDNRKLRPVSGFNVERRGEAEKIGMVHEGIGPEAAVPDNAAPQSAALPARITVFLFDDLHLSVEDLAHAREAGMKVLAAALTGSDMAAVVSISGRVNSGLTRDRAKLQEALMKLQPLGIYRADAMQCPFISYYEADLIENKHDSVAIQDANRKFANCNPAVGRPQDVGGGANLPTAENLVDVAARRALIIGQQDVKTTYASIAEFVRRMALLPGQRTLILVSPGFLSIDQEAMALESRLVDLAVRSNVTISALDARGLYTTEMTASERSPALSGPSLRLNSDYHGSAMTRAEGPMESLSDGTGGTYFHNSNDLDAGFRSLAETPQCVYVLELSLDGVKANGTYHRLKVKVDRKGVELQARKGYFIPKPDKHKK
jgi:VWFA-related protein